MSASRIINAENIPEARPMDKFVEKNRRFLDSYARDSSLTIKPAPPDLKTFAIDLDKGVIYGEPSWFVERGYEAEQAMFAFMHEIEHFAELRKLLDEPNGAQIWQKHRAKVKTKRRYHLLDNCWDDVRMNKTVVERAPAMRAVKDGLYKDRLFPEPDMRAQPKHLQFAYALLREQMLPAERCLLHPDVRAAINELSGIESDGIKLLDVMSSPALSPSLRIALQDEWLLPTYEKLFEEDVAEKKQEKQAPQSGESGEGESADSEPSDSNGGDAENDEELFAEEYDEFDAKNPDQAIDEKELEQEVEKYIKTQGNNGGNEADNRAVKNEGISASELKDNQQFIEEIKKLTNKETGELVYEELIDLFKRIVKERLAIKRKPKQPLRDGDWITRPADAVVAARTGDTEPAIWGKNDRRTHKEKKFDSFEISIIADRSGSMAGEKAVQQRLAIGLLLEALNEFNEILQAQKFELDDELEVKTEVYSFGSQSENMQLKELSGDLSEKDRVRIYKTLQSTPGSTQDYWPLQQILASLDQSVVEQYKSGEKRKIVVVLSDGGSDDGNAVKEALGRLRENGVVVVGVGVTESGRAVENLYAPEGQVCKVATDLPKTLADLLQKYLA